MNTELMRRVADTVEKPSITDRPFRDYGSSRFPTGRAFNMQTVSLPSAARRPALRDGPLPSMTDKAGDGGPETVVIDGE